MKVLLMRPNSTVRNVSIPLGLLYLAAVLRGRHEVRILDARAARVQEPTLRKALRDFRPDVVGLSLFTVEAGAGARDTAIIRQEVPGARIVLGGPFPSTDPALALTDPNADLAVIGEGEETLVEILERVAGGGGFEDVQGLAYRDGDEVRLNPPRPPIADLDRLPFPAYDLIDVEQYFRSTSGQTQNMMQVKKRALPIFTSRGCPFSCVYCHKIFGSAFRARSPENVRDELRLLRKEYGLEEVHVSDDIFNINQPRAKRILQDIRQQGRLVVAFPNGLRADRMDEELIGLLKPAGTARVIYAVESGSPAVQKRIRKNLDLDKAAWAIEQTVAQKVNTGGFFMLGFPDETREEMQQTVDFACSSPLHTASFFYVTPFPGTELYRVALERNIDRSTLLALYQEHSMDYNKPILNLTRLELQEFIALKQRAIRRFYFSPRRVIGNLRTMSNRMQLLRNAWIVVKLGYTRSVEY